MVSADKYRLNDTALSTDGYRDCKLLSRNIQPHNTDHLARSKINWLLVTTLSTLQPFFYPKRTLTSHENSYCRGIRNPALWPKVKTKGKIAIQWLAGESGRSGALHCAALLFLLWLFLSLFSSPSVLALDRLE